VIEFHPEVYEDIEDAYFWYESQTVGLGDTFLSELEMSYKRIIDMPLAWPKFGSNLHRFILNKFPFSVIYFPGENTPFVVTVMHNSRKPGYWKARV